MTESIFKIVAVEKSSTNLPIQLTSFVGRRREIARVKRLLDATRLLTLTGSGGAGKTRLALQVADILISGPSARARQVYSDGVWLVELAPLSDPVFVPQTVASAFGLHGAEQLRLMEALTNYLHSKNLLLLLDNCEHMIEACAQLADRLLRACPNVRILATSREALNVAGEVVFRVPSLAVPDPDQRPTLDSLLRTESVRLFSERASASAPEFQLTDANALFVAQICRHLDGMPLAIELAAARVRTLGIDQIALRLDNRFGLLIGGSRTALPRQQTLRATIDWSYDLLPEAERKLFRRLSVFSSGWTLEAAEEVCAGAGVEASAVLELQSRLIDKSLVIVEEQKSGVRYRLLETIRQYAHEKLEESGEAEPWQARQLSYFLKLAEEAEPHLQSAAQSQWLNRLETEHDNLHAALRFAVEYDQTEAGLQLAAALERFWHLHGYIREGIEWLKQAIANGVHAPASVRAKALVRASLLLTLVRDQQADADAMALAEESLALHRELGDKQGIANSLCALGIVLHSQGNEEQAVALLEKGWHTFKEIGDQWGAAFALLWLADTRMRQENLSQAAELWEESLTLFRTLGDKYGIAFALGGSGDLARHQGDYVRATTLLVESLSLHWEQGNKTNIPFSLEALGILAVLQEEPARAVHLWGAAEALRESIASNLPLSYHAAYAPYLATARARLGENAFESARAEGRALTLEQAIVEARQLGSLRSNRRAMAVSESSPYPAGLTAREVDVLRLLARGLSNQQIADQLVVSKRTVHAHLRSIYDKLAVTTRSAATRIAFELKIV